MPPFYRFNNVDLILAIQSAGVIKNISELIFNPVQNQLTKSRALKKYLYRNQV